MELARFPLRGGFSVRSIFTFALTALITALLWVVFVSEPTHAVEGRWTDGDAILYDGRAYNKDTTVANQTDAIPEGATVYKSAVQTEGSDRTVMVIYFASGVDPPAAHTATHVTFDYSGSGVSNPHNEETITLSPRGDDTTALAETHASCNVDGIGWIICPVTVFLAESMDWVYDKLEEFVATPALMLDTENNGVYTAWNMTRSVANVAFVIVFLIIIYSQLTSIGVSNYGLKKLTPRLIVAAVLVNVSFYISAIAIDISNILGYSVMDVFVGIRESVFYMTSENTAALNTEPWSYITTITLAGGGLIGGVYYLVTSPFVLVTMLVGLLFVAVIVFLVLAARQAIIMLLVMVAPLAFVANLLPNTEKWFERWRDLFMTMLVFFPAFAFIFGGSQLAGQLIIQNANGNIVTVLLGLGVQIAPLVITPYLLKLSGGLIGRIAQIANNPKKGIMDRTKGWADERNAIQRQRVLGKPNTWKRPIAKTAQTLENNRRSRKMQLERYQMDADTQWKDSKRHEKLHKNLDEAEGRKNIVETRNKKHTQDLLNDPGSTLRLQNVQLEAAKRALDASVKVTEADIKEFDAGHIPANAGTELQAAIRQMQASRQTASIEAMRAGKADGQAQRDFAEALKNSSELRDRAGGIQPLGASSVLASAVSTVRRADAEDIKNIMDASDLAAGDLQGAADRMVAAINAGNSIEARAYQNMLVTAGGAGLQVFRDTMITRVGSNIPTDISEYMRDNMLSNHGDKKGKANDLLTWAAKGGTLREHTYNGADWAGLSDKDFIGQHPKAQAYAFLPGVNAFSAARARTILEADVVEGNVLTPEIKNKLRAVAGLPPLED